MNLEECFECGKEATEDHHVIPQSLGGTKTVPLCGGCHDRVHQGGWKRRDDHAALTRNGLQKAKEGGVLLGNRMNLAEAGIKGGEATRKKALEYALSVEDEILSAYLEGGTLYEAAKILSDSGVELPRGGKWTVQAVSNIFKTLQINIANL